MDVFWAAKAGDLERVRELVDARPEIVNERSFDATALFYACHRGHYEVAKLLLERGAFCAEDTFDGDRCLYGALTDEIRHLLKRFSQRRTFVLAPLAEEISVAFAQQRLTDLELEAEDGTRVRCHRFVLAARLPALARRLRRGGSWFGRKGPLVLDPPLRADVLHMLLKYCYNDVLECPVEDAKALEAGCEAMGLQELARAIRLECLLLKSKPKLKGTGKRSVTLAKLLPLGPERMPRDFGRAWLLMGDLSDLTLYCRGRAIPVHSCMVMARCEYLRTTLSAEVRSTFSDPTCFELCAPHVFEACVMFLYTGGPGVEDILFGPGSGSGEESAQENLEGLLDLATQFLLPRLCDFVARCADARGIVQPHNAVELLETAMLYNSPALERVCFRVMAQALLAARCRKPGDGSAVASESSDGFELQDLLRLLDQLGDDVARRDYVIAEVREEFIEGLPADFSMAERDRITDEFEAAVGYQNTGAPALAADEPPKPSPKPAPRRCLLS